MSPVLDARGNVHDTRGRFSQKRNPRPDRDLGAAVESADKSIRVSAGAIIRSFRGTPEDVEDAAQDTWVSLLAQHRPIEVLITQSALLKHVARTVAKREYSVGAQAGLRHEDFQARRLLGDVAAQFKAKHGRPMTASEYAAAADQVRESIAPGRRPKPGFHIEMSSVSIDAMPEDAIDVEIETRNEVRRPAIPGEDDGDVGFSPVEDAAAASLHHFEAHPKSRVDVRRQLWRTITAGSPAPQIARDSLSQYAVEQARRAVNAAGGVAAVAKKWVDGTASGAEERALFAPFLGGREELTFAEQEQVIEVFERHPKFAEALWGETVKVAARHSSKSPVAV